LKIAKCDTNGNIKQKRNANNGNDENEARYNDGFDGESFTGLENKRVSERDSDGRGEKFCESLPFAGQDDRAALLAFVVGENKVTESF